MQYREDRYGNKLSVLGYGCMRFTAKAGVIDYKKAESEILTAYENGVNYFDTAYIYPGSETLLGKVFKENNMREKVHIATKLPHYLVKKYDDLDKIFNEELKRLQTDYIDYYFMHMLSGVDAWNRMIELGVLDWIKAKKQAGQIRQLGFSYHGNTDNFIKLLDAYVWDFCMIQYNYLDENTQAGKRGLKYANHKGLPVMIMEPLRGGRLVNRLPEKAKQLIKENSKQYTPTEWSFRWLWNQPEVTVVLSGMNSKEMILENVKTASDTKVAELNDDDFAMLSQVVKEINQKMKVGCTGCGYCMPCPKGVDIPGSFSAYNRKYTDNSFQALREHFMGTALRKNSTAASNCIGCGKCESHCPQSIPIREELKKVSKELEGPIYRIARAFTQKFGRF